MDRKALLYGKTIGTPCVNRNAKGVGIAPQRLAQMGH